MAIQQELIERLLLADRQGANALLPVESECRAVLADRRRDAHFILFTSGADVPLNTPPENINAMRNVAESFGRVDA